MSKLFTILFLLFIGIDCIVENLIDLKLYLDTVYIRIICKKGTLKVICTQGKEFIRFKDTKKETCFYSKISDGKNIFNVSCGLWNKSGIDEMYVFCNIEEQIPAGEYEILFNETKPFIYKNYKVTLKVVKGMSLLSFYKVTGDIIDIYADEQTIIFENGVDNYELKFNVVSYSQEIIKFGYI